MKILMILPLTLVMFVSRLNKGKADPFDYFSFSPLYLNGQTKLILKANRAFTFIVYITNDMYTERAILTGGPTKGGTYTYTYDNSYTRSTNKISISIKVGTKTTKSSKIAMNIESGKSEKIVDNKPITTDRVITTYNPDMTVIERVKYLQDYFSLSIYMMFLNVLDLYQDQGGNILSMADNLLRECTRTEKTLTDALSIGNKHLKEFIILWLMSMGILLFMRFSLKDFYGTMLKNNLIDILIFMFFIICIVSINLFVNAFTDLAVKESKK